MAKIFTKISYAPLKRERLHRRDYIEATKSYETKINSLSEASLIILENPSCGCFY